MRDYVAEYYLVHHTASRYCHYIGIKGFGSFVAVGLTMWVEVARVAWSGH
jgi:hypothetical protein